MWGNADHYTADFWDEMEEKKAAAKRNQAAAQEAYQEYTAMFQKL